jgi:hypothetical protein
VRRGIRRHNAAGFIHDDSSEGKAFKAGCQIDLRLGRHLRYTWQLSKSLCQILLEIKIEAGAPAPGDWIGWRKIAIALL